MSHGRVASLLLLSQWHKVRGAALHGVLTQSTLDAPKIRPDQSYLVKGTTRELSRAICSTFGRSLIFDRDWWMAFPFPSRCRPNIPIPTFRNNKKIYSKLLLNHEAFESRGIFRINPPQKTCTKRFRQWMETLKMLQPQ